MAGNGYIFQRVEKKYMLTQKQYESLLTAIEPHMAIDQYGLSKICNVYYDTADNELVRRSNEKPVYKEKMRLRSYGIPAEDDVVYLELKKKYRDVVYKRRVALRLTEAESYLFGGIRPNVGNCPGSDRWVETQIFREIDYFISFHRTEPKIYIAYDRTAWYGKEDREFRMTFDSHIRSRRDHLSLGFGDEAQELFLQEYQLLEIKAAGAYPMWLVKVLGDLNVYPVSFSKYGVIYKKELSRVFSGGDTDNAQVGCGTGCFDGLEFALNTPGRVAGFQENIGFPGWEDLAGKGRDKQCLPV
ncbi:MAG: polyphosphate polymerase domain-containing protein [Lachnospiraceae bacterium]|nr:polyphosphate polymerase domain-containing protein [Lachnospiraceae bacterium]